jgi:flavin-dependent dehydrogenase
MNTTVFVAGAGLAGLQCARLLALRGIDVVLADRKSSLAENVQTTGIFVRKSWEDFPLPGEQLGPPIRQVTLHSPRGKTMRLTAERDEFRIGRMQWLYLHLLEQCTRAGVRWLPATRVVAFEGTTAVVERHGRTERIAARFVIGADGARSRVARAFGLDVNREMLAGLEEICAPLDGESALHCWLDPRLAPGYIAWVASDGVESHVGVAGYRDRFVPAEGLERLRARLPFAVGRAVERRGGLIPVGGILRRIANERALLVGDAAGAVSPLTAGGLDAALRLSTFAAEVVERYLDSGDAEVLREYTGDRFRARFITRQWMRKAMRLIEHPVAMEAVCAMLRTPPLRALARHVFFARGSFPEAHLAPQPALAINLR